MTGIELRDDDIASFFEVPFVVYGKGSLYVSPLRGDLERALDVKRNPLFGAIGRGVRRVITAHRDGVPVGRIVALVHGKSNEQFHETRAYFGFFDCADDLDVARALLGEAERFAREQACDRLEGNFNLTAMQQMGVLTEGFGEVPYSDMHWNPPHIPRLLEQCGFDQFFPVSTYELDLRGCHPARSVGTYGARSIAGLGAPSASSAPSNLEWAELNTRDFTSVLEEIRVVLNDGFARNPMFVPLTPEEMRFQAADLSHVLDPRITALVRDADGPVGVVLCIPDLNPLFRAMRSRMTWTTPWHFLRFRFGRRTRAVIVFYSVVARRQGQGINGAMLQRVISALKAARYQTLGITWIADVNGASLRQMERIGARRLHRLHLYGKAVDA